MSKICLIMAQNVQVSPDNLRRRIAALAAERNVGAFFPTTASVGLTEYEGRSFICSVSDDFMYDNCERRLFPDDCWYNGTRSSTPFAERMNSVCDIVRCAADCSTEVELFIGDCGQCPLAEFEPVSVRLERLHKTLAHKRGKIRKRRTNNGEHNMFSGLLVCADCGSNLHFHFNQGNPEIKYFNCSNYKGNRGTCTSTHYVRVDFLEEVVLGEIRRLMKFASLYEDEFVKAVIGYSQQAEQIDRKLKEKELKTLLARDEELDGLFERIYEDNVSGKLSDDRFAKMSRRYEDEQKELSEKIKKLRSEIEKQSSRSMTTDMFIGLVRKYTRARKLTPRMLNELIEKIEVFNAEKIDGVWEQRLRIHYNCVGTIEIPTVLPLPIPEVSVNTRKGVVVNYAPCELAV